MKNMKYILRTFVAFGATITTGATVIACAKPVQLTASNKAVGETLLTSDLQNFSIEVKKQGNKFILNFVPKVSDSSNLIANISISTTITNQELAKEVEKFLKSLSPVFNLLDKSYQELKLSINLVNELTGKFIALINKIKSDLVSIKSTFELSISFLSKLVKLGLPVSDLSDSGKLSLLWNLTNLSVNEKRLFLVEGMKLIPILKKVSSTGILTIKPLINTENNNSIGLSLNLHNSNKELQGILSVIKLLQDQNAQISDSQLESIKEMLTVSIAILNSFNSQLNPASATVILA